MKKLLRKTEGSDGETPNELRRLGSGSVADVLSPMVLMDLLSPSPADENATPSMLPVDDLMMAEPASLYIETLMLLGIGPGDCEMANFMYKPCAAFTDALRMSRAPPVYTSAGPPSITKFSLSRQRDGICLRRNRGPGIHLDYFLFPDVLYRGSSTI